MLIIVVNSDNKKLKEAARLAPMFFKQLEPWHLPPNGFTHTDLTPDEVYVEIINGAICLPDRHVIVETYRPKWPWSKAIGYTLPKKPNYIFVNANRLASLDVADYVGNFTHEFTHLIGFKHKGNNPSINRNLESVPYVLGALAEAWARSFYIEQYEQLELEIEGA